MTRIFLRNNLAMIVTAYTILTSSISIAQNSTVTYQKNTDHELTIYFINGKEPGNTMMILGGIQGDEPGGYLAADLYADLLLEKGNLIVVPRANFKSIILNERGVNGDMNRKFADDAHSNPDNDFHIVDILKSLIIKSDVLLNLHDGSGFYNPEYISDMKNPLRYGQSIIADAATFTLPDSGVIELERTAQRVIDRVNQNINTKEHHFRFNNHNTLLETSLHKEQRKSATFFALTDAGIPAFGVETSKNINQNEKKVKYQTLVINAFMTEYGIFPEHPSIYLPPPQMEHLVIEISGDPNPYAVKNGGTLSISPGTSIHISSVIANYKRGLSTDILGLGNTNDLGRVTVINAPTSIKVYKDAYLCGEVAIEISSETTQEEKRTAHISSTARLKYIDITINNKNVVVSEGDTLHIVKGDFLTITDAWTTIFSNKGFRINFVGFVGNKRFNDAEDRGYLINTAWDLLEHRSLNADGALYRINVEDLQNKNIIGTVYIAIDNPRIEYLILEGKNGTRLAVIPGSIVKCDKSDRFTLLSIISNITMYPYIDIFVVNGTEKPKKLSLPSVLEISSETDIQFRRSTSNLGAISFRISG